MQEKRNENQQTPLFCPALWPRAPSSVRRIGMLREHNVFNITFFRPRALQDAGNVFSLPFIITLYILALSAIK
jgi:hypothetical protein